MTKVQRVENIFISLMMILSAALILFIPDLGYPLIAMMIWLSVSVSALRQLVYYFSMARHMVGGRIVLYRALILCDLAAFTGALTSIPRSYLMVYLTVLFGFTGLVDQLRALEARRTGGPWRFSTFHGGVNILLAVLCLLFFRTGRLVEIIYCISLVPSAALRLVSAFRRTAVIYIS